MEDYTFNLPGAENQKRNAFRATIPGLEAYVQEREKFYVIKDLSATGMGMQADRDGEFTAGESFTFDLYLNKKLYLGGLEAKVMRISDQLIAGCIFEEPPPRKEARLDKLVLEVQKRLIALRKAKKDKD